jgi:hypothetical protein
MLKSSDVHFKLAEILALLFFCMTLSSCSNYYFSSPQPVDSENMYQFPKQFRGTYATMDKDTEVVAIQIFEKSIKLYLDQNMKIINGLYVNPGDTVGFQKADTSGVLGGWSKHYAVDKPFESMLSIKFDSLNHPVDTVRNYILKDNKIYEIRKDGLGPGRPCSLRNDTIYCESFILVELGPLAFLRKLSGSIYVLNLASFSAASEIDYSNFWWEFGILEMTEDGKLQMRQLKDEYKSKTFYHPYQTSKYYFDIQWTKNEMLNLLEESDTSEAYRPLKKHLY